MDFVLASSALATVHAPVLHLRLSTVPAEKTGGGRTESRGNVESQAFAVDASKARVLLHELRAARALMEAL